MNTTQEQLEEVYREIPEGANRLTPDEVDRLANRFSRLDHETKCEGRIMKPFRTNPHD